jgi:hypothetical protein
MRRASSAARTSSHATVTKRVGVGVAGGAPVENCHSPLASPSHRYAAVQLVTQQPILFVVVVITKKKKKKKKNYDNS